jgi:hypothetical protein
MVILRKKPGQYRCSQLMAPPPKGRNVHGERAIVGNLDSCRLTGKGIEFSQDRGVVQFARHIPREGSGEREANNFSTSNEGRW